MSAELLQFVYIAVAAGVGWLARHKGIGGGATPPAVVPPVAVPAPLTLPSVPTPTSQHPLVASVFQALEQQILAAMNGLVHQFASQITTVPLPSVAVAPVPLGVPAVPQGQAPATALKAV